MEDSSDVKKKIRHGDHLTFVDTLKAQFQPLVDRDPQTGRTRYPREEYLTDVAAQRKREADEEARRNKGS